MIVGGSDVATFTHSTPKQNHKIWLFWSIFPTFKHSKWRWLVCLISSVWDVVTFEFGHSTGTKWAVSVQKCRCGLPVVREKTPSEFISHWLSLFSVPREVTRFSLSYVAVRLLRRTYSKLFCLTMMWTTKINNLNISLAVGLLYQAGQLFMIWLI